MQEQWLSIIEYARIFNISDMTVRRRIKSGRLKASLREGKYYIAVPTDPRGNPVKPQAPKPMHRPVVQPTPKSASQNHLHNVRQPSTTMPQRPESNYERMAVVKPQISSQTIATPSMPAHVIPPPPVLVDGVSPRAIVELCQSTLARVAAMEKRIESESQSRIHVLEERLKAKDMEVNQFRQQVEDLQLLVEILEKKRIP